MSIHPGPHESRPTPWEIRDAEAFAAPLRAEIARLGWTVVGSRAEGRRPSWLYTVGLLSTYDHPEFIAVGQDDLASQVLLALLAMRVADGERFSHESLVEVEGSQFELGWVHPRHFDLDTFDLWKPLMGMCPQHFRPAALQVLPLGDDAGTRRRWVLNRPKPIR